MRLLTVNVSEGRLRVAGIDVLDGSPLPDIKPYVPDWDRFPASRTGWLERASGRTRSRNRFLTQADLKMRVVERISRQRHHPP